MDSGLGSDDEKRNRTKAQKQLQNEQKQLFSGCFIDATSLGDEGEFEHRRNDERRQGALVFRSSIPQYSMLQMPDVRGAETISTVQEEQQLLDMATPHNSIVQLESEVEKKTPIGFYVDLGDVEVVETEASAAPVEKKNIFSMVIDFNVAKREMPSRLSSSLYGRRKQCASTRSLSTSLIEKDVGNGDCSSESGISERTNDGSLPVVPSLQDVISDGEDKNEEIAHKCEPPASNIPRPKKQYVKLSDLEAQSPRLDLFISPRMSRSIPEKSWVESPLAANFHSASYRSSPQPFQSNLNESSIDDPPKESNNNLPPKRSAQRLGTDLLRMFLEEINPDVTLDINGRRLRAHKCILSSRCQYFAAVFGGKPSENVVSIQGYSYAAVHFALCHIYSGAAHVPHSISLVELGALADMLALEGLKEVVAHALKIRHCHSFHNPCAVCITGVVEILPLSAAYGLDELYQESLQWITKHFVEVWPNRTFVALPRELRNKCYQQHVVYMSQDNVLDTTLECDRLLAAMPSAKWAEPVAQLTLQLADHCQVYLRQNYAAILASPKFVALDSRHDQISQLEDGFISSGGALKLDQAYRSYMVCRKIMQKNWSSRFVDMLRKIHAQIESCVVRHSAQASRSKIWMQLEPGLRKRIRDLSSPISKMPLSSSSDSSRNSSPAIKNTQVHSPSLRRSLLIAARTSQSPSSPSVVRRTSTLTNPTQSSAAKSNAVKNVSSQKKISTVALKPNVQKIPTKPIIATANNPKSKKGMSSTRTDAVTKTRVVKKATVVSKKEKSTSSTENVKQSPGVRRSGTFLKEEPTVLGKM